MKRKIIGFFIILTAAMIVCAAPSLAANWQDEGIPQEPPMEDGIYRISTSEQLAWVAQQTNLGIDFYEETFVLTNNIDLSSREWTAIGNGDTDNKRFFLGSFDGRGFTISGLRQGSREQINTGNYSAGLFGKTWHGIIKNIVLDNIEIYSDATFIGGIVGHSGGTISYCTVSGIISQIANGEEKQCAGGITGENNLDIIGCESKGKISGTKIGGIAGINQDYSQISHCGTTATISGENCIGKGIVAVNKGNVSTCFVAGKVECIDPENGFVSGDIENLGASENVYYNYELVNEVNTQNPGRKSTTQMKSPDFIKAMNTRKEKFYNELDGSEIVEHKLYNVFIGDASNKNNGYPVIYHYQRDSNVWINDTQKPDIEGDTYLIRTPQQLAWISEAAEYNRAVAFRNVKLMNDIDLSGKQWIPICGKDLFSDGSPHPMKLSFNGTFDGNFKTIKGLEMSMIPIGLYPYEVGLIGGLGETGTIKNVGLTGVNIKGEYGTYIGSLVGSSSGTIQGCFAIGSIKNTCDIPVNVGGLIGWVNGGEVRNCFSQVNIEINDGVVGGLVSNADEGMIVSCYTTAGLTAKGNGNIGALIGKSSNYMNSAYLYWNINSIMHKNGEEILPMDKVGIWGDERDYPGWLQAKLKQKETYEYWDFENDWDINSTKNEGFPFPKGFYADEGRLKGIELSDEARSMAVGAKWTLLPTFTPAQADDKRVTWVSSNPAVATVDENGVVTAIAYGNTVIMVRTQDGGFTDSCTITVTKDYTLGKIKLTNMNGGNISSIPSNGQFMANIEVQNNGSEFKGYLVIAAYDANDQFIGFSYIAVDIPAGSKTSFGTMLTNSTQKPIKKIKAFVWDGLTTIKPLSDVVTYTV